MPGTPIGKEREYWIKFDIDQQGRSISGVRVKLARAMERDMNAQFRVDLCDDPLFPALVEYIIGNTRNNRALHDLLHTMRQVRFHMETDGGHALLERVIKCLKPFEKIDTPKDPR